MVLAGLGCDPGRSRLWSWQVWAVVLAIVLAGLGCGGLVLAAATGSQH